MKAIPDIIYTRRKEFLIACGIFAAWVFSQYLYRLAHGEPYTLAIAMDYITGFTYYMIGPWLVTIFIALCGYVVGRIFLKNVARGLEYRSDLEESVWAISVGLGLIAVATFLIGLAKLLYSFIFFILAGILLSSGHQHLKHLYKISKRGLKQTRWKLLDWVLFLAFAAIVLSNFFRPCNPSVGWDALNSHLAAPKFYLREHAITFYKWINFNNFPQIQEMLLTLQMMIFKDPGCSIVYFSMVMSGVVTYLMGERYLGRRVGIVGAILYLLIHEVYWDSLSAYVEHVLVLFTVLMFYGFLAWYETRDKRWLVLAGIAAGISCGVKYLGVTTTFLLLVVMCAAYFFRMKDWDAAACRDSSEPMQRDESENRNGSKSRESKVKTPAKTTNKNVKKKRTTRPDSLSGENTKTSASAGMNDTKPVSKGPDMGKNPPGPVIDLLKCLGVMVLWTAVIASPWYIRNLVMFGNPFFPFFENIFGGLGLGTLNEIRGQLTVDHAEMLKYFRIEPTLANLLLFPWNDAFHNNSPWNSPGDAGFCGPFFLALTPALILVGKWRRSATLIIIFVLLFYGYWLLIEKVFETRYVMNVFWLQSLLAAWGFAELAGLQNFRIGNKFQIVALILLVFFGFGFYYRTTASAHQHGTSIQFTPEAREEHLLQILSGYRLIEEAINNQIALGLQEVARGKIQREDLLLTDDTMIYGLACENRRFYVDCHLVGSLFGYANHFDFMAHAGTGQELYEWLRSYGCEYLLVNNEVAEASSYVLEMHLPDDPTFNERFEELAIFRETVFYRLVAPGEPRLDYVIGNMEPVDSESAQTDD